MQRTIRRLIWNQSYQDDLIGAFLTRPGGALAGVDPALRLLGQNCPNITPLTSTGDLAAAVADFDGYAEVTAVFSTSVTLADGWRGRVADATYVASGGDQDTVKGGYLYNATSGDWICAWTFDEEEWVPMGAAGDFLEILFQLPMPGYMTIPNVDA